MVANHPAVKRIIIGSHIATVCLPEGQQIASWCAWDADTERRLCDTESMFRMDTLDCVQMRYRDAIIVAEITAVEKGGRL